MDPASTPLAHILSDGTPHPLADHLHAVAALAAGFAAGFGADWARLAGLWHDLGKYRPAFQRYLRAASGAEAHIEASDGGVPGRTDHSAAGALWARQCFASAHPPQMHLSGRVLEYLIASHHTGLYDWPDLQHRLDGAQEKGLLTEALAAGAPADILEADRSLPAFTPPGGRAGFALWLRMLFSCLVDADFLDTETFMTPQAAQERGRFPDLAGLSQSFDAHMVAKTAAAPPTPVNRLRAEVLAACRAAASERAGLFSLTVPTGGGKTLAALAFALEHARRHGLRRVIHVIPYTSIIEQTAGVFRAIFGEAVIEHHSNAEVERETARSRLACENWDAPVIVTTAVQFFESLFAARTSRCRKLHNIAGSVVVLDEAQLLPVEFLQPVLDVLRLLAAHYSVTVLLSTATQPALNSRITLDSTRRGLDAVHEIIPDPAALAARLQRTSIEWPADFNAPRTWSDLAAELAQHEAVLAIVNRRSDALALYAALPPGTLHLSGLMCGAHRSQVIGELHARLADPGRSVAVRVVSTSLVECGVDLDFPVVYRALAGLDSIAQAAGRCNREGLLAQPGHVHVFVPPTPAPAGLQAEGEAITRVQMIRSRRPHLQPSDFTAYFDALYQGGRDRLDRHGIVGLLTPGRGLEVQLRTAASRFRLIDEEETGYHTVFVRYRPDGDDTIDTLLATLKRDGPQRWLMRRLQRYVVSLPERQVTALMQRGDLDVLGTGYFVLKGSDACYDPVTGVVLEERPYAPAGLVV